MLLCFDDSRVFLRTCCLSQKKEGSEDVAEPASGDADPPFGDDPSDLSYQPQSQRYARLNVHPTLSRLTAGSSVSSDFVLLLPVVRRKKRVSAAMKISPLQMT